jgi:phosphatidylglycerol---prolipoprotein diacylglyceryl transferase
MRQTLIRIFLDEPWALWKVDPVTGYPGPGIAVFLLVLFGGWLLIRSLTGTNPFAKEHRSSLLIWAAALLLVSVLPMPMASLPIFGYGLMLLIGFLSGLLLAQRRAVREGIKAELLFDMAFWVLVSGIVGARLFYVIQYHEQVFGGKQGVELLFAAVNLSGGGIVLYGSLLGGAAAFFWLCWKHQINSLHLADIVMPSVFVGEGFGRIGCLLNGCCYGDRCEQPWGIVFPSGSVPWQELVHRGFLDRSAPATFALHPTQIYSSINAFLIAWVLIAYYPRRRHTGEVFALGCVLYPISRFVIELLRADEMGQFGTDLTISQIVSLGVAAVGMVMLVVLSLRNAPLLGQQTSPPSA